MKKFFLIFISLINPVTVFAAEGIGAAGEKLGALSSEGVNLSSNLQGTTATVVSTIFYVVGTIFLGLMIYGGIVWAKSAGREEEINRAKKIIFTCIIGLVVVMASYGITNFILSNLAKTPTE